MTSWSRAALPRLDALIAEGVTTIEIKSGYGLALDDRAPTAARGAPARRAKLPSTCARRFSARTPCRRSMKAKNAATISICVCARDAAGRSRREGLADAVDAFCESIAFTPEETARVFAAATQLGLPVRLHADQLSNLHGAALAASSARCRPIISNMPMRPALRP